MSRAEWLPDGTWRDPDCIECGGDGAPCCDPPDHPPPGVRAWWRWHLAGLLGLPARIGYWARPYDMLADRRRWRWQPPTPCGRQRLVELPPAERASLVAAVREMLRRRGER